MVLVPYRIRVCPDIVSRHVWFYMHCALVGVGQMDGSCHLRCVTVRILVI